jgi:hypothetical protein
MTQPEPDKRLELAYEAAQKSISADDTNLGNLRTRANNLLGSAALFTSFATGVGLINTNRNNGDVLSPAKGIPMLIVVIALGLCALYVLWPATGWMFGASASEIMAKIDPKPDKSGHTPDSKNVDQIRRDVITTLTLGHETNKTILTKKQRAFRGAAGLLVVQIVVLVVVLWFWNYVLAAGLWIWNYLLEVVYEFVTGVLALMTL